MSRAWIYLLLLLVAPMIHAEQAPLRVALAGAPPFVIEKNDVPSGFAIDLWQNIATEHGWQFSYRKYDTTNAALDAVAKGECDLLVGNTSITSERESMVEFSQPFYRSGLQIMVSEQRGRVARFLEKFFDLQNLEVLGGVVLMVIVFTIVIEAFERRHNPDFPKTRAAGFAEAFYYVMGLVTGKSSYKGFSGVLGRLVLVCWMIASLFVVSYVTGVIASSMTADALNKIKGPGDLQDKLVGLIGGSESEDYAREKNLDYVAYHDMDTAVAALVKGKVECLIGDAPVLEYYDFTHPRIPIHEVGAVFQPVNYGFAMPLNSPLREPINVTILRLFEGQFFKDLGTTYFGESYQK
jgi:ABC-type amino acid transport substrate-binding protein